MSDRNRLYVSKLADKFGSLGLVAVVVLEIRGDESVFDSFIMSCRAMGFQFEQAVIRLVLDAEPAVTRWIGLFVPTDRNTPAASLFPDSGFVAKCDHEWILDCAPIVAPWFVVAFE